MVEVNEVPAGSPRVRTYLAAVYALRTLPPPAATYASPAGWDLSRLRLRLRFHATCTPLTLPLHLLLPGLGLAVACTFHACHLHPHVHPTSALPCRLGPVAAAPACRLGSALALHSHACLPPGRLLHPASSPTPARVPVTFICLSSGPAVPPSGFCSASQGAGKEGRCSSQTGWKVPECRIAVPSRDTKGRDVPSWRESRDCDVPRWRNVPKCRKAGGPASYAGRCTGASTWRLWRPVNPRWGRAHQRSRTHGVPALSGQQDSSARPDPPKAQTLRVGEAAGAHKYRPAKLR